MIPTKTAVQLFLLALLAGCASVDHTETEDLTDLLAAGTDIDATLPPYGLERTESDLRLLETLHQELDMLDRQMTRMTGLFSTQPDRIEQENEAIELMLLRFVHCRDALQDLLHYYSHAGGLTPGIHARGTALGMSAGLHLCYYDSRFAALFYGHDELVDLLNAGHPRFELPAGMYDRIVRDITDTDQIRAVDLSWHLFMQQLNDPGSTLSALSRSDSDYETLTDRLFGLYADTRMQMDYLQYARHHGATDFGNRMYHSRMEEMVESLEQTMSRGAYKTRSVVFKDVARIKTRSFHLARFSDDQVRHIKSRLQPGDVLLTYTAGYMSDVFLPGSFKHGITYIGTVDDRRQAGLTDQALKQAAISEQQHRELLERVNRTETVDGQPVNVIEAVAEGVVMHSLDYLLATHINRMLVLRPRITPDERRDQLVTLFQYTDAPYDFKFDFMDDSRQCCTELVYRTLNGKSTIDFSLSELKGRWILDADGIARYASAENPDAFDIILLTDTATPEEGYVAIIYEGPEGRKRLTELLSANP